MRLFRKGFWVGLLKVLLLGLVLTVMLMQLPELAYDLGSGKPMTIDGPDALTPRRHREITYAVVPGPFDEAWTVRHNAMGLTYRYVMPRRFDGKLVIVIPPQVEIETDPNALGRAEGKLWALDRTGFERTIRERFSEEHGIELAEPAFALMQGGIPRVSGWNVASVALATMLWLVLFYLFFIRRPGRRRA